MLKAKKKTNNGKKKCFQCGRFFPAEEMRKHIGDEHPEKLAPWDREIPASHTQVEEFEETSGSLQRDLDEANEAHAEIVKRFNRADRKEHVYREALTDLCRHLITILELEREF